MLVLPENLFPLRPILNEDELDRAIRDIDKLVDMMPDEYWSEDEATRNNTPKEYNLLMAYLEELGDLILAYETLSVRLNEEDTFWRPDEQEIQHAKEILARYD
jgi:hypothetical protein